MTSGLRDLTDVNRIIHEPVRLMIVSLLYVSEEADFVFLQREAGLTKANLSATSHAWRQSVMSTLRRCSGGKCH